MRFDVQHRPSAVISVALWELECCPRNHKKTGEGATGDPHFPTPDHYHAKFILIAAA